MSQLVVPGILILLSLSGHPINGAPDREEAERKAAAMKEEAAELKRLGRAEEAEKLAAEAGRMLKEAMRHAEGEKRSARDHEAHALKQDLHELESAARKAVDAGNEEEAHLIREKATRVRRELGTLSREHRGSDLPPELQEQGEKLEWAGRRLHHLKVAAENLKAAELHDLAHEVTNRAEMWERELAEQKKQLAHALEVHRHAASEKPSPEGQEAARHLRRELEQVRQELRETREAMERMKKEFAVREKDNE